MMLWLGGLGIGIFIGFCIGVIMDKQAWKVQKLVDKAEEEVQTTGKVSEGLAAKLKENGINADEITAKFKAIQLPSSSTKCVIGIARSPEGSIPGPITNKPR